MAEPPPSASFACPKGACPVLDQKERESAKAKPPVRAYATGAAFGAAFTGPLTAIVMHKGELPLETLSWIIEHGSLGFALVALVVVGAWGLRQQKRAEKVTDDARQQQNDLLHEQLAIIPPVHQALKRIEHMLDGEDVS